MADAGPPLGVGEFGAQLSLAAGRHQPGPPQQIGDEQQDQDAATSTTRPTAIRMVVNDTQEC